MLARQAKKLLIVTLFALVFFGMSYVSHTTKAAACANTANYGVATWSTIIPEAGTYVLWARMYTPGSSGAQFQLEVDGANCWQIGGGQPANAWTWVNWYGGTSSQKTSYTFTSVGNHTIKAIGLQPGVLVDKVILLGVDEKCSDNTTTPSGTGDNCASGPATTQTGSTPANPTNTITSGQTTPAIVAQNTGNIAETTYIVDGKVLQTSKGAAPLDTSKLSNGTHSVQTVVKLKDGQTLSETQAIIVDNKPNYVKIIAITLLMLALFLCVVLAGWILARRNARKYRQIHEPIISSGIQVSSSGEGAIIRPESEQAIKNE